MNISYNASEDLLTVKLTGEIDHHTAKTTREEIDRKYKSEGFKDLILDMSSITFCDSSGLGLIMGRYKTVKEQEGNLSIKNPSSPVDKMITLSGMDRFITIIK